MWKVTVEGFDQDDEYVRASFTVEAPTEHDARMEALVISENQNWVVATRSAVQA